VLEIALANRVSLFFPKLKRNLRIAHLDYSPVQFVSKNLKVALLYSVMFCMAIFFVLAKAKISLILILPIFFIVFIMIFNFLIISVRSKISSRAADIDKEVLFVGRYLLVKIYSGRPLLNALIETSKSRGIAPRYIKEIVDDIDTGSTLEDALDNAMIYSPSDRLRRILFHVNNALQIGVDVTKPLESVLEEITKEEELEIEKYGKKLNSLVIFYMLGAVIIPSLGVAIFVVIASFISFPINLLGLTVLVFFLVVIEIIFITIFKSSRPTVNL
jgi:pilus assembly protein TadC